MGKTGRTFLSENAAQVHSLYTQMMNVDDLNGKRERKHPIGLVLTLLIIGYLCERTTIPRIHRYLKNRISWLEELVGKLPHGLPSLVTFYRTAWETDFVILRSYAEEWMRNLLTNVKYEQASIFIDGKSIRASSKYDAKSDKMQPPYIVHAIMRLTDKDGKNLDLYLGSEIVGPKSNEIPSIPKLLKRIYTYNKYISLDAIGTQIEVFEMAEKDGSTLVVPLKDNQKSTREAIEDHINLMKASKEVTSYDSGLEKGHGRYERRTAYAVSNVGADLRTGFDTARYSCVIERTREDMTTGKKSTGSFYYLSNRKLTAEEFAFHARDHWGIEERNNWMDTRLYEDRCFVRKGNGLGNLALLRRIAHNVIQMECYRSNVDPVGFNEHFDSTEVLERAVFTEYPYI